MVSRHTFLSYYKYGCQFLLFLLIIACNSSKEQGGLTLKKDYLSMDTPELMPINTQVQLIASDSGDFLFLYNYFKKSYQFLEFPGGRITHEIPLNFEGPNSIKGFSGGSLTNLDSIWILTSRPPSLALMNFKGEVILKRQIKNELRPIPVNHLFTSIDKPLTQHGGRIFGPQPFLEGHHQIDKEDIKKYQLLYSYDFKTDSVQWHPVFYREDYWDLGKKLSQFSWAQRDGKMYIAPWYDHEIQEIDMVTGKVTKKKEVKSSLISRFNYVNEIPTGINEGLKNKLSHDRYGVLIYDQYRDFFYRMCLPGMEILEEEHTVEYLNNLNYYRPYTGIMVLDKDLNLLHEHLFDKFEVYTATNFFVGKKGLYLSVNNLFAPDYDEDRLRYMLLTFE